MTIIEMDIKNPEGKEQKLMKELFGLLNETTAGFVQLNKEGTDSYEMFVVLTNAAIGYCFNALHALSKTRDKHAQKELKEEFIRHIHVYIDDLKKEE